MGKGAKPPAAQPLPAPPDPNADEAAKSAAAAAKTNEGRRLRTLASGSEGDLGSSPAPTSAPQLKSTLGGGTSQA